jgi:hypothetical protein
LLDGLGVQFDFTELDVLAVHSRLAAIEQQPQRFDRLVENVAALRLRHTRPDDDELVAAHAQSKAEQHPAIAEAIERRDLLGENDRIAKGRHQNAGAELDRARAGRAVGKRDHGLVPIGRRGVRDSVIRRRRQKIRRPHGVETEPLGLFDRLDDIRRAGEAVWNKHTFTAGRYLDVEFHCPLPRSGMIGEVRSDADSKPILHLPRCNPVLERACRICQYQNQATSKTLCLPAWVRPSAGAGQAGSIHWRNGS